jgi:hypothetical protein
LDDTTEPVSTIISPVLVIPDCIDRSSRLLASVVSDIPVDAADISFSIGRKFSGSTISTIGSVEPVRYSSPDAATAIVTESVLRTKKGKIKSAKNRVQPIEKR